MEHAKSAGRSVQDVVFLWRRPNQVHFSARCLGLRGGGRDSWGGGLCWHMVFKLPGRAAKGDET